MTLRLLPDFLTHGHPDFPPRAKCDYPYTRRPEEPTCAHPHEAATRAEVTREWLAHVEAGRTPVI